MVIRQMDKYDLNPELSQEISSDLQIVGEGRTCAERNEIIEPSLNVEEYQNQIHTLQKELNETRAVMRRQAEEMKTQVCLRLRLERQWKKEKRIYEEEIRILQSVVVGQTRTSKVREKSHLRGRSALLGKIQWLESSLELTKLKDSFLNKDRTTKEEDQRRYSDSDTIRLPCKACEKNCVLNGDQVSKEGEQRRNSETDTIIFPGKACQETSIRRSQSAPNSNLSSKPLSSKPTHDMYQQKYWKKKRVQPAGMLLEIPRPISSDAILGKKSKEKMSVSKEMKNSIHSSDARKPQLHIS